MPPKINPIYNPVKQRVARKYNVKMVSYYCFKKKDTTYLFSGIRTGMPICESGETLTKMHQFIHSLTDKQSPNSESKCEFSNVCSQQNIIPIIKVSSKDCLSAEDEEGDTNVNQLSPSCLEVYYNLSILSDGERNDFNFLEAGRENCFATNVGIKSVKDNSVILKKFKSKKRNINRNLADVKDISSKGLSIAPWQHNKENQLSSSTSTNNRDPKEANIKQQNNFFDSCTDIVAPSKFLFEYLASRSNIQISRPMSPLAVKGKDPCPLYSKSCCCFDAKSQASLSKDASSLLYDSLGTAKSPDNFIKAPDRGSNKLEQKQLPRHVRSHSDGSKGVVTQTSLISSAFAPLRTATSSCSSEKLLEFNSDKNFVRKRFMDDGGHSITPVADGFFPHPQPGQNLMDFLSSSQFSKTSAQLDKENAHFNIAEAVLAAIEQMNFDNIYCKKEKVPKSSHCNIPDESEDDFSQYKRTKIPLRRRPRIRNLVTFSTNTSDDDPVTTDYSIMDSGKSSASSSDFEYFTDNTLDPQVEPSSAPSSDNMSDPSSAENVAISLLMHYNTNLLPKANELHWLVTEQDAPQKLLPMPNSVAVSPDDSNSANFTTLLRGTSDWAPPRPQLILTLHVNTKRSDCLTTQKWRCAGCGLKVSENLSRHFRLCHYLGRYFCTNCHNNKKAIVPARVLHKWDFKKYPVCNFSSELLSRMSSDPLFHVGSLNSKLYRQSRDLHQTHIYRLQLYHTRIYINICSRAIKEKSLLANIPLHWSTEPHIYSLDDLIAVKQSQMVNIIRHLTTASISHISSCHVCLGQGFICEICGQGNPIFPFQLDAVTQCTKCRECFHFLCFSPVSSCPRCARREKRGKMIEVKDELELA